LLLDPIHLGTVSALFNLVIKDVFITKEANFEVWDRVVNFVEMAEDQADRFVSVPFARVPIENQGHSGHVLDAQCALSPIDVVIDKRQHIDVFF
jgi:hypothetical protein